MTKTYDTRPVLPSEEPLYRVELWIKLAEKGQPCPVPLNEAANLLGLSIERCQRVIARRLVEGEDYTRTPIRYTGGRPRLAWWLTLDSLQVLAHLSDTNTGWAVRHHLRVYLKTLEGSHD
jgi:hypothetical protein